MPLENFWWSLAGGKYVVVIYITGKYEYITLPNSNTEKLTKLFNNFYANKDIITILSSNSSQDAYEVYLYP